MRERTITTTSKLKALGIFEQHLFNLLPLYNPSYTGKYNQVIQYSQHVLSRLGRKVYVDEHWNIISHGKDTKFTRVMVAHTDSIGDLEHPNATLQSIKYNTVTDIIYNDSGRRPMGADDKVGVAIALTMVELLPELGCWLFADEEVGLVGSSSVDKDLTGVVDFALQFDRKNAIDLVAKIGSTNIASKHTAAIALNLLPHRQSENGGSTDVAALVRKGIARCAFNMSCGYYQAHTDREYIVYAEALMAMSDAMTLMFGLNKDDVHPADDKEHISTGRSMTPSWYGGYNSPTNTNTSTTKTTTTGKGQTTTGTGTNTSGGSTAPKPTTPTTTGNTSTGTGTQPQALPPTNTTNTTNNTNGTGSASTPNPLEDLDKSSTVIRYPDGSQLTLFRCANTVECDICGLEIESERFALVRNTALICETCLRSITIQEAEEIVDSKMAQLASEKTS